MDEQRSTFLAVSTLIYSSCLFCVGQSLAHAELPASRLFTTTAAAAVVEDIADLTRRGQHYAAIVRAQEKRDTELSLVDKLAVARSAWALGLIDVARRHWDEILVDPEFQGPERDRTMIARAILEFQEFRFEKSREIAQRAVHEMNESELKNQFWLVIAESLKEQRAFSQAEKYYQRAVDESRGEFRDEALYLLSVTQLELGVHEKARENFAAINMDSPYAAQALYRLTKIDFSQRNFAGVLLWINEGQRRHPDEFYNAWAGYAHVVSLLRTNRPEDARNTLTDLTSRFQATNPWILMATAAVETNWMEELLVVNGKNND